MNAVTAATAPAATIAPAVTVAATVTVARAVTITARTTTDPSLNEKRRAVRKGGPAAFHYETPYRAGV